MEITIEIPEKKAPFVMELLRNLKFLKIKYPDGKSNIADFLQQWNNISAQLPQDDPDISEDDIMEEIRAVRRNRAARQTEG